MAGGPEAVLTECRYALTLYFPVLVGKHVSATNFVTPSGSAIVGSLTSALTQDIAVGNLDNLRLLDSGAVLRTDCDSYSSRHVQCR